MFADLFKTIYGDYQNYNTCINLNYAKDLFCLDFRSCCGDFCFHTNILFLSKPNVYDIDTYNFYIFFID